MKRFLAGFLTGTLALPFSALLFLHFGFAAVGADSARPSWITDWLEASTHASIRRQARQTAFPTPQNEQDVIAGGKLYLNDCVGCHSAPGKAASDFGATFYPPAPQFALHDTTYTEAEAFWAAKHGIRRSGMGAESGAYPDDKLRQLAAFICRMNTLSPGVMAAIQEKQKPAAAPEASK